MATELELAGRFGVSRVTVRKALKLLEDEGLIVRKRRLGTFPAQRVVPFRDGQNIDQLREQTAWLAAHSQVRLLRFGRIEAPAKIRRKLDLSANRRVLQFSRIRFDELGPIAHLTSYLPAEIARGMTQQQLLKSPPLLLLQEIGIAVSRTEQTVSAELATPSVAAWLEVAEQAPLVRTSRRTIDDRGNAVAYTEARLRADRYELRYTLDRESKRGAPEIWRLGDETSS